MTVLFCSSRPLGRCGNITAVYEAYNGDKEFAQIQWNGECPEADEGYPLIVTDEFLKKVQKPQTKVIMLGHGSDRFKKYGLDQKVKYYSPAQTSLIDVWVVSGGGGARDAVTAAAIPRESVMELGMPRTDCYASMEKGSGKTLLAKYERSYLFAPTLRAGWEPALPSIDWAAIDSALEPTEILAVKRHMVTKKPLLDRYYGRIVEEDPMKPSIPYIADCDVIVTDYSSIIADAYLMGKPAVLFCPDKKEYLESRGMYMDYPDFYSDIVCESQEELVEAMRYAAEVGMTDVMKRCMEQSVGACDGHATERIVNLIGGML